MLYPVLPNCTFGAYDQFKAGDLVELTPTEALPFIGHVLGDAISKNDIAHRQKVREQWAKEDVDTEKARREIINKWAEEDATAEQDRLATSDPRYVANQRAIANQIKPENEQQEVTGSNNGKQVTNSPVVQSEATGEHDLSPIREQTKSQTTETELPDPSKGRKTKV